MENALRDANQKNTFLLSLTANDHLWGFRLTGYVQSAKDGKPYAGQGEMFWQPTFSCGILNPSKPGQSELHATASALQDVEREKHAYFLQRNAQPTSPESEQAVQGAFTQSAPPAQAQPAQTNVTASPAANTVHAPTNLQVPTGNQRPDAPMTEVDDLPF
jgi:hypothetical protein